MSKVTKLFSKKQWLIFGPLILMGGVFYLALMYGLKGVLTITDYLVTLTGLLIVLVVIALTIWWGNK